MPKLFNPKKVLALMKSGEDLSDIPQREPGWTHSRAHFSPDQVYRYRLDRYATWAKDSPAMQFIMLNPSTADAQKDDPTIRKCWAITASNKFTRLQVVNLFAARATDPSELLNFSDPIGQLNFRYLDQAIYYPHNPNDMLVCAWGCNIPPALQAHERQVRKLLYESGRNVYVLRLNKKDMPWHPLYMKNNTQPMLWDSMRASL